MAHHSFLGVLGLFWVLKKITLPSFPRCLSARGLVKKIQPCLPQYLLGGSGGWVENEKNLYLLPRGFVCAREGEKVSRVRLSAQERGCGGRAPAGTVTDFKIDQKVGRLTKCERDQNTPREAREKIFSAWWKKGGSAQKVRRL